MILGLERSTTRIYDRIVLELAGEIERQGHAVRLIDPTTVTSLRDLLSAYGSCDWAIITNSTGVLSLPVQSGYLFEAVPTKLAFLHHDAPFNTRELEAIRTKLRAFQRVRERSLHFSIEASDESDLNRLGIPCHPIRHISTIGMPAAEAAPPVARDIAFIGHVVPPILAPVAFGTELDQAYFESYLARIARQDHRVKEDFEKLQGDPPTDGEALFDRVSRKAQYIQYVNSFSLFQRGAILQGIAAPELHVFGGDPAWIHGVAPSRFLTRDNVRYHPPVFDHGAILDLFRSSAINLNITSLQFDSAVINRVLDCAAAGGFLLTDHKEQLFELTSVAAEISFRTPPELFDKIRFYLDPAHAGKRQEIARVLAEDIRRSCSPGATIGSMLDRMSRH